MSNVEWLTAMSPSTMPFGPELTAEGLRTLRFSKGRVEWPGTSGREIMGFDLDLERRVFICVIRGHPVK